jgi:hypothetical protein
MILARLQAVADRPSRARRRRLAADWKRNNKTVRGELRHQARASRHKLVFGRSVRIGTMMQSCASAAKLRGGGPILNRGSKTMCKVGLPPPRSVICSSPPIGERTAEPLVSCPQASRHVAGRRSRPARTSPVVTSRQSAIRSFRASATIMVLRVPPRASAVRFRYHSANTLSF